MFSGVELLLVLSIALDAGPLVIGRVVPEVRQDPRVFQINGDAAQAPLQLKMVVQTFFVLKKQKVKSL